MSSYYRVCVVVSNKQEFVREVSCLSFFARMAGRTLSVGSGEYKRKRECPEASLRQWREEVWLTAAVWRGIDSQGQSLAAEAK